MFHEITKDKPKFKQIYFQSLGLFLIPLVEIWGSYYSLATGNVEYAVKTISSLSFFFSNTLVAFWIIIAIRLEIPNPSTTMIATPQIQKLDSEPESDKLKEDRNKIFKVKVNFLGLLSVEQEIKDDEVNRERKLQIDIAKLQTDVHKLLSNNLSFYCSNRRLYCG